MKTVRSLLLTVVLASWSLAGSARATVVQLDAIDSTTRYLTESAYYWTSDRLAVQSSYATLSDGHLTTSYGYVKFNFSSIPDDASIISLTLTASVEEIRTDNPAENPPPNVSVFRVGYDSWAREGNTFIDLNQRLSPAQLSYTSWPLDVAAVDWTSDLIDDRLTLALVNETVPAFHPNSYIYNWVFLYGSDTAARPRLTVSYIAGGTCCISNGTCEAAGNCQENITQVQCQALSGRFFGPNMSCAEVCVNGGCIPAVSTWGIIVLLLLLATAGTIVLARGRIPAA